jgi:outer membrane lipoprotein-sorting protein
MTRLKARWRLLTAVLAGGVLISGAVAAVAAQGSSAVRLPPIATDRLIASTLRAIADGRPISGHVAANVDLGLLSLPTEGLPNSLGGAADFLTSLSGNHRLRVWRSADGLRVTEILPMSERSLVVNRSAAWFWDFSSFTAYVVHRPADARSEPFQLADPLALARMALGAISPTTAVSVGRPASVAGRPSYALLIEPRTTKTLVRRIEIDIDATERLPLRVAVYARGRSAAPLSATFTQVSFAPIDPSTYRFSPPPGAKVRNITPRGERGGGAGFGSSSASMPATTWSKAPLSQQTASGYAPDLPRVFGTGWASVVALRTPSLSQLRMQMAGFDITQFLPFSGPLLSIRLVDRGDHGWLIYGLVPQSTLAALESRLH